MNLEKKAMSNNPLFRIQLWQENFDNFKKWFKAESFL